MDAWRTFIPISCNAAAAYTTFISKSSKFSANDKALFITADGGGSNSTRCRLWKTELQALADEIGIPIEVSHFPPGTSKWNKIEHRLFAMISKNWAGKPLISVETIVSLIGSTTTKTGLKVICKVDKNHYETGLKVSDADFDNIDIEYLNVGTSNKWNYIIRGFKLLN